MHVHVIGWAATRGDALGIAFVQFAATGDSLCAARGRSGATPAWPVLLPVSALVLPVPIDDCWTGLGALELIWI